MLTLKQVLRASHVRRWGIVATSRDQSVAEHQYNVCMIARALCKRVGIADDEIIKAALEHDLDEVIFGDIPSPMKATLLADGVDINSYVANQMRPLTKFQLHILKTADLLDAYLFLKDHAVGSHAIKVCREVRERTVNHCRKKNCFDMSPTVRIEVKQFIEDVMHERI